MVDELGDLVFLRRELIRNIIYPSLDWEELKLQIKDDHLVALAEQSVLDLLDKVAAIQKEPRLVDIIAAHTLLERINAELLPRLTTEYQGAGETINTYCLDLKLALDNLKGRILSMETAGIKENK